jgi:uncharacterized membrane protein
MKGKTMLEALIFFTFIAGVFTGIAIIAMIFAFLVNKDENKKAKEIGIAHTRQQMEKVGENPFVPKHGPIIQD